jgi:quercetin dioxygenase-like cupin family protein
LIGARKEVIKNTFNVKGLTKKKDLSGWKWIFLNDVLLCKREADMKSVIYGTWKVWMIGFIFLILLTPASVIAQGKEPGKFKLFKTGDFIKMTSPTPAQLYRLEILTDKDEAKNLGGIFGIMPPAAPGAKPVYHYHKDRESIIMVLSGEATEMVEGQAIPLKAGDIIFIRPMVKHTIMNHSGKDFRYIEFFTHPPVMADFVPVK